MYRNMDVYWTSCRGLNSDASVGRCAWFGSMCSGCSACSCPVNNCCSWSVTHLCGSCHVTVYWQTVHLSALICNVKLSVRVSSQISTMMAHMPATRQVFHQSALITAKLLWILQLARARRYATTSVQPSRGLWSTITVIQSYLTGLACARGIHRWAHNSQSCGIEAKFELKRTRSKPVTRAELFTLRSQYWL